MKLIRNFAFLVVLALIFSTGFKLLTKGSAYAEEPMTIQDSGAPADLALINGVIYTGDSAKPRVEAIACRGEKIVATGTTAEIRKLIDSKTSVIDLHGRFAMPGFNDAHLHMGSAAQAKLTVNLEGAKSLAEFQKRIRDRVAQTKPGEWITGRGWDHTLWSPANFPTRKDLDGFRRNIRCCSLIFRDMWP